MNYLQALLLPEMCESRLIAMWMNFTTGFWRKKNCYFTMEVTSICSVKMTKDLDAQIAG